MNCFEVVQKVLDATYAEIPVATRDAAITQALNSFPKIYRENLLQSGGPDFSDPVTRFAYVFRYVPSHAHWLYELITWSEEAGAVFKQDRIRVTCMGGGPGIDLVGILKYMAKTNGCPSLFCEIVDGCIEWKRTWSDLAFTLDWRTSVHTDYVIHDVLSQETWRAPSNFEKADIFTLNFFASEIFHHGNLASKYLSNAFGKAKLGALILFNDNCDKKFYDWIDELARIQGFIQLLADRGERKIRDSTEQSSALGNYADKFGTQSKLTGKLAWRVFRKIGDAAQ